VVNGFGKDRGLSEFPGCTDAEGCCLHIIDRLPRIPGKNRPRSYGDGLHQEVVPSECPEPRPEPLFMKYMPIEDALADALANEKPS